MARREVDSTYGAMTSLLESVFKFALITSYMSVLTEPKGSALVVEGVVLCQLLVVYFYRWVTTSVDRHTRTVDDRGRIAGQDDDATPNPSPRHDGVMNQTEERRIMR